MISNECPTSRVVMGSKRYAIKPKDQIGLGSRSISIQM
jgi:hypothetical protein